MDDAAPKARKRIGQRKRKTMSTGQRPSTRMKRLTLDLPESLHRAIKRNAVDEGMTMAEKLRALLMKHYRFTEETL